MRLILLLVYAFIAGTMMLGFAAAQDIKDVQTAPTLPNGQWVGECAIRVFNNAGRDENWGTAVFFGSVRDLHGVIYMPTTKVGPRDMNDTISSFYVKSGRWYVCADAQYWWCRGPYGPGSTVDNLAGTPYQDKISSIALARCDKETGARTDCGILGCRKGDDHISGTVTITTFP